jgi:cytochrome c oxidase subunit 2
MPAVGAPALAGLSAVYVEEQLHKFRSGHRGLDPNDLAGMRMRPMAVGLSGEADIKAVSQYVSFFLKRRHHSEATVMGDPKRGLEIYATCSACHGFLGEGNDMLKAPALAGADDWYLEKQLHNFRSGSRGSAAGDELGAQMQPFAKALKNDQAVKDVVAYIQSMPAYE